MKYLSIIAILLSLTACNNSTPRATSQEEVSKEYLKSGQLSGTTDFGILTEGASKLGTFRITNNGTENLVGPLVLSGSDFSLAYQSGCQTVLPNKVCNVKVSFNSKGKAAGIYTTTLTLDSVSFELQAEVEDSVIVENIVFTPSNVDFGVVTQSSSVLKNISIKNTSAKAVNKILALSNSNYAIAYDSCSGKNIAPGGSCSIKISLSGAGKSGTVQSSLSFGDLSTTATLTAEVPAAPPSDVKIYNEEQQEVTSSLHFGLLDQNTSVIKTLTVKNIGGSDGVISIDLSGNPNYSLSYTNCKSPLKVNAYCLIKVKLTAPISSTGSTSGFSSFSISGPSAAANTDVSADLKVNDQKTIELQGEISSQEILPVIEFSNSGTPIETLTYSEIEFNKSLFKTIYIKNLGVVDIVGQPTLMTASGTGFTISYTNCTGNLKPSGTCVVRLGIVGFGSSPGTKQNVLQVANMMLPVSGSIAYPPINCPVGQEARDGVCRDIIVLSKISIGTAHACSLDGNKNLRCWGANYFGQLGINSLVDSPFVRPVSGVLSGVAVDQVVAFSANTCALAAGKVYCWGYGYYGGVGNGLQDDTLVPVEISTAEVFSGRTIVQLVGGGYGNNRVCALDSAGGAICWGQGPFGPRPTPVNINSQPFNGFGFTGPLVGKTINQFFLDGYNFSAIVSGVAYGWGGNFGGNGVDTSFYSPELLGTQLGFVNQSVQQIAHGGTGANHCAMAAGKVYCWGNSGSGEMGDGVEHSEYSPYLAPKETLLYSVTNKLATEIAVGVSYACALVEGKVYCWGNNEYGQLGDGTFIKKNTPVLVGIDSPLEGKVVTSIFASGTTSCASTTEGKTYCWGYNGNGELGRGTKGGNFNKPVETVVAP